MKHYSEELGYSIIPISKDRELTLKQIENFKETLFEKFGVEFIHLLPYINGNMVVHLNPNYNRIEVNKTDCLMASDILRPETVKRAVEVLGDQEIMDLYQTCGRKEIHGLNHPEWQKELIQLARKLHKKILAHAEQEKMHQLGGDFVSKLVPSRAM